MSSRLRTPRRAALLAGVAGAAAVVLFGAGAGTYAAFSDTATVPGNSARAAIWQANPPAGKDGCGDLADYRGGVVYVDRPGGYVSWPKPIEVLKGKLPRIIMVSGGNAVIHAGLGDCIVAGPGDNKIIDPGLARTILPGSGTTECVGFLSVLPPYWWGTYRPCPSWLLGAGGVRTSTGAAGLASGRDSGEAVPTLPRTLQVVPGGVAEVQAPPAESRTTSQPAPSPATPPAGPATAPTPPPVPTTGPAEPTASTTAPGPTADPTPAPSPTGTEGSESP